MSNPIYRCSQSALYQVATNVYQSLSDNLINFTAFKAKYVTAYVTAAISQVAAAEALPDFQARSAQAEVNYNNLTTQLGTCTDLWQNLKRYIITAYSQIDQKARLEEAGSNYFLKATTKNWDAARAILLAAKNFLTTHNTTLLANQNMPPSFSATFNAQQAIFATQLTAFQQSEELVKIDTEVKITANNNIYTRLNEVCLDGQQIFRNSQAVKDQFVFATVLSIVSGIGTTGFKGYILNATTNQPIPNATINIAALNQNFTSDANGYYEVLQIPAGVYSIIFSAPNYLSLTQPDYQIDSGITRNLSIALTPDIS